MESRPSKRVRTDDDCRASGLPPIALRRMQAIGLPLALIISVWIYGHHIGVAADRNLNGIEYFSGCESFSDACRRAGMQM